jgi:flagellar M-ring protein FliF
VSVTHNPQGRLRRISVAVALNQGKRALTASDMAKIDALVKGAVGFEAARGDVVAINQRPFIQIEEPVEQFYEKPWFEPLAKQGGAILLALLAFIFIGRPMMRAAKQRKIDAVKQQAALENQLMAAIEPPAEIVPETRNREITLDMIEAAPSYEDRANLVRAFVRQDSERAALVVRQLMQGAAHV